MVRPMKSMQAKTVFLVLAAACLTGTEHYTLAEGDSFSFPSHLPHRYANPSADTDTVVVWANTPITLRP